MLVINMSGEARGMCMLVWGNTFIFYFIPFLEGIGACAMYQKHHQTAISLPSASFQNVVVSKVAVKVKVTAGRQAADRN